MCTGNESQQMPLGLLTPAPSCLEIESSFWSKGLGLGCHLFHVKTRMWVAMAKLGAWGYQGL